MMYLSFFFFITLMFYGLLLVRKEKKDRIGKRMQFFLQGKKDSANTGESKGEHLSFFQRIVLPIWIEYKKSFKKRIPGEKEARLERKLQLAGEPFGMTPVDFRMIQSTMIVVLPVLSGTYSWLLQNETESIILFGIGGLVFALFLPSFYLRQKMKTRNYLALRELPDVLDLLTVSLEAGLGFDSAISKLISKKDGVLADEFRRCLEEIRLGKTRREALSGIRDRVGVEEVRNFIGSILQAEKLGIGMVQVLRVQSGEVRDQRKQRAEEAAMKAPIKMLFPLVLFIFPSLFIVLLGPAIIQIIETLSK